MRFMRTLFVASAVLVSTAGCTALDAVRWTTPLDTAKDTQTVTDAIAKARQAGSAEHAAVLAGDPVALAQAGEAAGAVESAVSNRLGSRIQALETEQQRMLAGLRGFLGPVGAGSVADLLTVAFGKTRDTAKADAEAAQTAAGDAKSAASAAGTTASSAAEAAKTAGAAATTAQDVADAAQRDAASAKDETVKIDSRLSKVEEVARKIEPETLAAIRQANWTRLDELSRSGVPLNRDAVMKEIEAELERQGLSQAQITRFKQDTEGLSTEEILALVGALAGGGVLGTAGGRGLSSSGKKIESAKTQIDELYDEIGKLRERLAALEGRSSAKAV